MKKNNKLENNKLPKSALHFIDVIKFQLEKLLPMYHVI